MEQEPRETLPAQDVSDQPISTRISGAAGCWRPWRWLAVAVLGVSLPFAGYFLLRNLVHDGNAQDLGGHADKSSPPMFVGWEKSGPPDLAIVVSGQMYGYLQPCGCSYPQKGGLARRYNLITWLKDKGWTVAALDVGDIAQTSGPQRVLKYVTAMNALKLMGYKAIGIGKNEFLMPFTDALGNYAINEADPRLVAANLANTSKGEFFHDLNVRKGEIFDTDQLQARADVKVKASAPRASRAYLKVGVIGAVDDAFAKTITDGLPPTEKLIKFLDRNASLPKALEVLGANKVDLGVVLYQGHEKGARDCADSLHKQHVSNPAVAAVHLILCETEDEEPPSVLQKSAGAPNTSIVTIGHKGRYVGVLGVWKTPQGIDLKYQLVAVGPEFETKPGQAKGNPILALMEKYAEELKTKDILTRFPRGKHEIQVALKDARYVGSERCGDCHAHAYNVWAKSRHAHAYDTLVNDKNPSLRQFDGECVVCHTVGFKYNTGYYDPPRGATAAQIAKHNKKLLNVGCENCHGPGSEHTNNPNNAALYPMLNPYRPTAKELNPATPPEEKANAAKQRQLRLDIRLCAQCHDPENDVNWGNFPFQEKWGAIAHPTPKGGAKGAGGK
jgi:hypothetical protein